MSELVPNLRDLGGLEASGGRRTAYGVLLRSAAPAVADVVPDDIAWPPAQVIDLRSPLETGPGHPLRGENTSVRQIPLLEALRPDAELADPEAIERLHAGGLPALYVWMLHVARAEIVEVARLVADSPGPTLVHCAAGKDRTGVVIALVLRTVGVSRADVVTDYLETEKAADAITARLATLPVMDPDRPVPPTYLEVPVEAINAVLDVWDEYEGGAAQWLEGSDGDAGLAEQLRVRLLEA